MRLIDADKIAVEESEAYIYAQCRIKDELTRSVNAVVHTKIQRLIADTPTVDAVAVVRCKDCKHCCKIDARKKGEPLELYYCSYRRHLTKDCDFCSEGERRQK